MHIVNLLLSFWLTDDITQRMHQLHKLLLQLTINLIIGLQYACFFLLFLKWKISTCVHLASLVHFWICNIPYMVAKVSSNISDFLGEYYVHFCEFCAKLGQWFESRFFMITKKHWRR